MLLFGSFSTAAQNRIDKWTTDNGLPQNSVTGLVQTPDGYIWFTTNDGLVRFDGFQFKVFNKGNTPAISNNRMFGAFADKSGRLWTHLEDGGILLYEKGVFTLALKADEVPPGLRSPFFDDTAGAVIFYVNLNTKPNHNRHYRYQNGRFVPFEVAGVPDEAVLLLVDREGGLWFGNKKGVLSVKDGKTDLYDFKGYSTGETYRIGYQDRLGNIWISHYELNHQSLIRIRNGGLQNFPLPSAPVTHFAEDRSGNLWVSLYKKGVYRIAKDKLTADQPSINVLELVWPFEGTNSIASGHLCSDREGGMWVGTDRGLVRILAQIIRVFSTRNGLPEDNVYPIYEDRAGKIWAGLWESSLVKFENGRFTNLLHGGPETQYIASLFEDRSGRFWVGNLGHLRYLNNGKLVDFTVAAGFSVDTEFSVITEDRQNNLWFGTNHGLGRYSSGRSTLFTKKDGLPDDNIVALLPTAAGDLWIGTRAGLALIQNGKISTFSAEDGLASNFIRSLYEDSDRTLWIGSYDGGLTRFKEGKFTRFTTKEGLSSNGVFCILEDDSGWLWMNSNQGIFRIRKQELNDFADGRTKSLTSISYNKQDGLLNIEGNGGRQPAGIRARDGTLWFPTAQGIAVVDPQKVATNQLPPPVMIQDVIVDRISADMGKLQSGLETQSEITLRPGQNNLEIDYTGISFINSAQVKFKYRLDGLDRDWNEVGTRRAAYYSYLPPGPYTFHVIAANRDGIWNNEGAILSFSVAPSWYQTIWFRLSCVAAFLVLVWALYQLRRRQLAHQFSMGLEARVNERTRIARELHDTLLQSFHGLLLRFQAASNLLPTRPGEAKHRLDTAIDRAAQAITEGRDAVHELRSSAEATPDLPVAISALGQELAEDQAGQKLPDYRVQVEGTPRNLDPILRDEVYRIAAEAMRNAFRHAEARHIEVEIRYDERQLRVRVRDDGKGIDPKFLGEQERTGHWGLNGMRERAQAVGGNLTVWSEIDSGSEIEVTIPASIAYAKFSTHHASWWSGKLFGNREMKP
jgi:signal transduction histidine kinase/ligand-binding sensor domain-containing protein